MQIVICGAGAIGSALGGYLAESGARVLLLARGEHLEVLRREGLTLRSPRGILRPPVTAAGRLDDLTLEPDDFLFLTSKSQDTPGVLAALTAAPRGCAVFCFQNGVRNEERARELFPYVYGGVVGFSVNWIGPGVVEHTILNRLALGRYPDGIDAQAERASELLGGAGFDVKLHPRVMALKWGKLLVNLSNALYALIDTWQQHAYADPALCAFMAETMREGLRVMRAAGVEVAMSEYSPEDFIAKVAAGTFVLGDAAERSYPSTWQDVRLGRPTTEVEHFNGEIVALGEKVGLPTPYNSTLLAMMRELLARRSMPGLYKFEAVVRRVAGLRR